MQATDSGQAVYWGTGRRKSAIARVRLIPGEGKVIRVQQADPAVICNQTRKAKTGPQAGKK